MRRLIVAVFLFSAFPVLSASGQVLSTAVATLVQESGDTSVVFTFEAEQEPALVRIKGLQGTVAIMSVTLKQVREADPGFLKEKEGLPGNTPFMALIVPMPGLPKDLTLIASGTSGAPAFPKLVLDRSRLGRGILQIRTPSGFLEPGIHSFTFTGEQARPLIHLWVTSGGAKYAVFLIQVASPKKHR